ncbi:MAG TPA: hypothetical protein VFN03_03010 [Trueperaceae bacterium]|nr:hypothetical protein [Trueperaceae bacterium]
MSNISYINEMGYKERGTWIELLVAIGVFVWYASRILGNLDGTPIADVAFRGPMIRAVVISIVVTIVAHILYAILTGATDTKEDQRDRQISRFGDWVGMWPLVLGAASGLILAMYEQDHFWIANSLYVGFVLSSITSSIARLVSYRSGMVGA